MMAGGLVRLVDTQVIVHGANLLSPAFSVRIDRGCDGLEAIAALCAAILVSPATMGPKLLGIVLGIVILMAVNLVRLASLFVIGIYWRAAFDMMHEEVWQAVMIVLAIVLWSIWWQHAVPPMSTWSNDAA